MKATIRLTWWNFPSTKGKLWFFSINKHKLHLARLTVRIAWRNRAPEMSQRIHLHHDSIDSYTDKSYPPMAFWWKSMRASLRLVRARESMSNVLLWERALERAGHQQIRNSLVWGLFSRWYNTLGRLNHIVNRNSSHSVPNLPDKSEDLIVPSLICNGRCCCHYALLRKSFDGRLPTAGCKIYQSPKGYYIMKFQRTRAKKSRWLGDLIL